METVENRGKISQSFMDAMQPDKQEETVSPDAVNDITNDQPEVEVEATPEVAVESDDVDTSGEPQGDQTIEVGEVPTEGQDSLEIAETETEETTYEQPKTYEVEGVQKLVDFMKETGGTMEDYMRLNRDTSALSETALMSEYLKSTRPHLDNEDIKYLIKDMFDIDEDVMDESELRSKKIALKEQMFNAKTHLDSQKEQYFNEIKSTKGGASVKDLEFEKLAKENNEYFLNETDKFFGDDFKGFNFALKQEEKDLNVRYRVENKSNLKDVQSDLNKILGGFLGDDGRISDIGGYHKAMFAAQNADKIAQMFFDQGFAMAVKQGAQKSKNTDFNPTHHEATSSEKLQPGQAREIAHPNADSNKPRVRLKYGMQ